MNIITDKNKALAILDKNHTGKSVKRFSPELRDDRDVILKAVQCYGGNAQYASERLRNDPDIMLVAVKLHEPAFVFCGSQILSDRKFILCALSARSTMGAYYNLCSQSLQGDRSFAHDYLGRNAFAFKFLPKKFKHDKELAHVALQNNIRVYPQIRAYHKDDETLEIALKDGANFRFLSKTQRDNQKWVTYVLEHGYYFGELDRMGPTLKNNKELFKKIIAKSPTLFSHASETLKEDTELLEMVVQRLNHRLPLKYNNATELVKPLIGQDYTFLAYASKAIKEDKQIILNALKQNLNAITYASQEIKNMLGNQRHDYIERLEKIIEIENFQNKLDTGLSEKQQMQKKNKI